jgi:hypothetical protein
MNRMTSVGLALCFGALASTQASACDWGCNCAPYGYRPPAPVHGYYYTPPASYGYYAAPAYSYYAAEVPYAYHAAPPSVGYYRTYSYRPRVYSGYYGYAGWRRW